MRMPKRKRLDVPNHYLRSSSSSIQVLNGENNVCDKQLEFNNSSILESNNEKTADSSLSSSLSLSDSGPLKNKLNSDNLQGSPPDKNAINNQENKDNLVCSPNGTTISQHPPQDCFKSPLNPNDLASSGIRRKSNRILSLKRLNQNCSLVTSSSEDIETSCSTNQPQTSNNNHDKPQQNADVSSTLNPAVNNTKPNTSNNASSSGKTLRKIQAWTEDDIRWFFEALCEHGKDFPHIQSYIASRCEKKGIPSELIKNYEQVRHFYYRMWHKISQILTISPEVDKAIQEIYGLINYGEIWKKLGSKFECKLSFYLQQLVDYGYTVVKMKGKSIRIRTPVCNALKKIHNIDNKANKSVTQPLPKEILIELIPASNSDWLHVHSMSQNPRLRTKLTMQQRISTLISYLEKRWSIGRLQQNVFRSVMGTDLIENNDDNKFNYYIRLRPQNSVKMCDSVTLKSTGNSISYHNYRSTSHGTTQIDLSLSAYMKNMFNDGINSKKSKIRKRKLNTTSSSIDNNKSKESSEDVGQKDTNEQKEDITPEDPKESNDVDEPQPTFLFRLLDSMNEELEVSQSKNNKNHVQNSFDCWKNNNSPNESETTESSEPSVSTSIADVNNDDESRLPEPPAHQTLAQWLAGDMDNDEVDDDEQKQEDDQEEDSKQLDDNNKTDRSTEQTQSSSPNNKQLNDAKTSMIGNRKRRVSNSENETLEFLTAEKARQGWDLEEGKTVTIGELYLLLCQPTKIVLEYTWNITKQPLKTEPKDEEHEIKSHNIERQTQESEQTESDKPLSVLQKFLIAANLTLMNYKKTGQNNNHQSASSNNGSNCTLSTSTNKSNRSKRGSKDKNSMLATKPSANNNSSSNPTNPLLYNLIQETILNNDDPSNNDPSKPKNDSKSNIGAEDNNKPSSSNQKANNLKNHRSSTVDPTKVEEVLKELKIHGRQRRFHSKFLYNNNHHQQQQFDRINLNGPVVLLTGEGSNSKQIVLTANMPATHTQTASISLAPVGNITSSTTAIQLEAASPNDSTAGTYLQLVPQQATTIKNDNTTNQITTNTQPQKEPSEGSLNFLMSDGQQQDSTTSTDIKLKNAVSPNEKATPTITTNNIPWLQDISLGSLFCDTTNSSSNMVSNASMMISPNSKSLTVLAMNPESTATTSSNSSLPNDIETHMNTFANDNSVDLMAQFADLAEQITSQDIKTTIQ